MSSTGIVRRIDDLGRIVIPKEIRRTLHWQEGDSFEMYIDSDGGVLLKRYSPIGDMKDDATDAARSMNDATGFSVVITDRDKPIAIVGEGHLVRNVVTVQPYMQDCMDKSQGTPEGNATVTPINDSTWAIVVPIIIQYDCMGCVTLLSDKKLDKFKSEGPYFAKVVAGILKRKLER